MSHSPGMWTPSGQLILGPVRPHPNPKATPSRIIIGEVHWDYDGDHRATEPLINWQEAEANQRLICAAPELLRAGQLVVDRWCEGDLAEAVRMLDAAVRKAKGEDTQEPAPRGWDKV